MAGPVELMIVVSAFGIVGTYLYIVSRFVRAGESEGAGASAKKTSSPVPHRSGRIDSVSPSAAH